MKKYKGRKDMKKQNEKRRICRSRMRKEGYEEVEGERKDMKKQNEKGRI